MKTTLPFWSSRGSISSPISESNMVSIIKFLKAKSISELIKLLPLSLTDEY